VIDVLGAKWVLRVLRVLEPRPLRHNELQRAVNGIHAMVLDDTLRRLEAAGLVERQIQPATPPGVSYGLTRLGYSVHPLVEGISQWVIDHVEELAGFPVWQSDRRSA
jgi:DNA-binding HxlR family transcriptional regulator